MTEDVNVGLSNSTYKTLWTAEFAYSGKDRLSLKDVSVFVEVLVLLDLKVRGHMFCSLFLLNAWYSLVMGEEGYVVNPLKEENVMM